MIWYTSMSMSSTSHSSSSWQEMDECGPEKVVQVYDPDTKMKEVLVIDNNGR